MCGIAGFIGFNDKGLLARRANEIQQHRGPDGQGVWEDLDVALSHQRLAIIDLSERAGQPLVKNKLVITYNGELYNYKELKRKHLEGIEFKTDSDTEVIIEMYRKFGTQCLQYFEGMFSFAIYDLKARKIFLARDHFGIKPFYFYQQQGRFAFASELKCLTKLVAHNKKINKEALVGSLNYLWIPGSDTILEEFSKIPPAHYLIYEIDSCDLTIKRYWELNTSVKERSEIELVQEVSEQFKQTMKRHMVADVPVSSFLSGGLDSSMIAVAAGRMNEKLSTYTIGTAERDKKIEKMPSDEKFARKLADAHNFDHEEIILEANITERLPEMVRSLDEPLGDPAALNTFLICRAAREKGVKVLLSGMGADEIFCGYRRQKALLFAKRYKNFPKVLRWLIKFVVNSLPVKLWGRGFKFARWAKKFLSFAEMPDEEAYRMSYSYYTQRDLEKVFQGDIKKEIRNIYDKHKNIFTQCYSDDLVNQMCFTDINMFMVGLNLAYTDKSSMAASVEVRVPFIDKRFISHAMSIPGKFKFRQNESKYILKKAAEDFLPKEIIYRAKASFGAPIRSWISGELRPIIDELLSKENIEKRGIFNHKEIKQMIQEDRRGVVDNAYKIYHLLTIELWFQEFIDQ